MNRKSHFYTLGLIDRAIYLFSVTGARKYANFRSKKVCQNFREILNKRTSMVKAATQATIPVQSKTSESIRMAQMDLFLSQLMQLPILELFSVAKSYTKNTKQKLRKN